MIEGVVRRLDDDALLSGRQSGDIALVVISAVCNCRGNGVKADVVYFLPRKLRKERICHERSAVYAHVDGVAVKNAAVVVDVAGSYAEDLVCVIHRGSHRETYVIRRIV